MKNIELFISHTSVDNELVESFANCIANCFNIYDEKIRCSSAGRFKYDFGIKLLSAIKSDIENSIVIAFVTKNTKLSEWVLLELGIAMTMAINTIVVVMDNYEQEDIPKFLQGDSLHVNISDREQLHRFIFELQKNTKWEIKPPKTVNTEVDNLLTSIKGNNPKYPIQKLFKRKNLFEEKNNLRWLQISSNIKKEINIVGWSCRGIFNNNSNIHFQKMLESGIRVNIIIQSPNAISNSPLLNFGPVCNHKDFPERIIEDIEMGKTTYQEFYNNLSENARMNISLSETNYLITWSAVAVDMETNHGFIQIEFYHYDNPTGNHLDDRPNLILTPKSEFYLGFKNSIENIKKSVE
jgi:hypothetical protein